MIHGANFAPTGATQLLCLFADETTSGLRDGSTSDITARYLAANRPNEAWVCGGRICHMSAMYRRVTRLHFITHNRTECELPTCPNGAQASLQPVRTSTTAWALGGCSHEFGDTVPLVLDAHPP